MSGSSSARQSGLREIEKMTGRAIKMAMFITCRVKMRARSRWKGLSAAGAASTGMTWTGAGLSGAEMESIFLQYLWLNLAGKRYPAEAHTPWYCRQGFVAGGNLFEDQDLC